MKLVNISRGCCGRLKLLNVVSDGGGAKLSLLLLLLLLLKILYFLKASNYFIMPSVGVVLVPFQHGH